MKNTQVSVCLAAKPNPQTGVKQQTSVYSEPGRLEVRGRGASVPWLCCRRMASEARTGSL